jgi:hypothetical protein
MFRLIWFIAGAVAGYIASGYVEGLAGSGQAGPMSGSRRRTSNDYFPIAF